MAEILNIMLKCISQGLLHSIWQSIIIYGIYLILMQLTRKYASVYRYWISVSLYAVALLSLVITIGGVVHATYMQQSHVFDLLYIHSAVEEIKIIAPNPIVELFSKIIALGGNWLPYIALFWLIGFGYFIIRYSGELRNIRQLYTSFIPITSKLSDSIKRTSGSLGLTQNVQIVTSSRVTSPITFGFLKPVVVLSEQQLPLIATSRMQSLLMHELAHIKRHDYVANIIQALIDSVFFFNPFLRVISDRIRREREICCDEMVLHTGVNPIMYARTLTDLYSIDLECNLSMRSTGGLLSDRVMKILNPVQKPNLRTFVFFLLISAIIIIGMIDSSRTQYYRVNGIDYSIEQFQVFEKDYYLFK